MLEKQLLRGAGAPGVARTLLDEWFGGELDPQQLADAKLLASELVTNAVVHGAGGVTLRALVDHDRLRVEVVDEGSCFEYKVRKVGFDEVRGRGLLIVDAVSSRWGIAEGTTHVWFELERPGPRLGAGDETT